MAVTVWGHQSPDGDSFGQSGEKISFYGATTIVKPTSANLSSTLTIIALPGASFVADAAATVSGVFAFTSLQMTNLINALQAIRTCLVNLGLHSGGA